MRSTTPPCLTARWLLTITLLASVGAAPALAQNRTPAGTRPTAPKPAGAPAAPARALQASPITFSDAPLSMDEVGLTMSVPLDATVEKSRAGTSASTQLIGPDGAWRINIATPRTSNPDVTAADVVDKIVTDLFASVGVALDQENRAVVGVQGAILEPRRTVTINGREAQRVYVGMPPSAAGVTIIRGYTVFKVSPTQFITFEFMCPGGEFERIRSIYETTLATIQLTDISRLEEQRAAANANARAIWAAVDEATLREIVAAQPAERWERLYRPASSGLDADDTEIGYRRIRVKIGTRGEVDPGRRSQTGADNQEGIIVRLDARVVDNPQMIGKELASGRVFDSRSIFFVTPDRNEETWTVQNTVREAGTSPMKSSETGARIAQNMVVEVDTTGQPPETVRPGFQTGEYLSRAESWLIPAVLLRQKAEAEVGFYVYQSDAKRMRLRRDLLEKSDDPAGLSKITTRLGEDRLPQASFYNAKGEFVRTELPDGSIWEPITVERLISLWKSKGLPMD